MSNLLNTVEGSLEKQLIQTKVELEGLDQDVSESDRPKSTLVSNDISKLRENIQKLTQLANPLGKALDYLQEDINSMISEAKHWREEREKNQSSILVAQTAADEDIIPLKLELDQIDREISRITESIDTKKASIIRNDQRIEEIIRLAVERNQL